MNETFRPARLGPLTLSNHVVMAPMTRSRALGNVPNEMMAEYYAQRASAGLIVTEGTAPSPEGLGYSRIPGLFNEEQARGWKQVTEGVHARGGKIFVQLMHTGRIFHPLNLPDGVVGVAPSAVAAVGKMWTDQAQLQPYPVPRALDRKGLETVREAFAHSARLADAAGFDGVELHGANGYLLEQFLNPATNRRDDEYGGSVENRARFVLEVTRAVVDAIGADRTAIRLSPWGTNGDMPPYSEIQDSYAYLATELERIGVVYLHVIRPSAATEATAATLRAIRERYTGTLVLNGAFRTLSAIDAALESGDANLVSIGSPFVANPDLVERLRLGTPLVQPNPATFFSPGPGGFAEGFLDYPSAA
jgi:N-ethylmaleimide reductase